MLVAVAVAVAVLVLLVVLVVLAVLLSPKKIGGRVRLLHGRI